MLRFLTPHERRMHEAACYLPVGLDSVQLAALERRGNADVATRERVRRTQQAVPRLVFCRCNGGSGLGMSQLLRHFFLEYVSRMMKYGFDQMPSSFNVLEAFFQFSQEYGLFDLRREEEHLLRAYDFFNWYTSSAGALVEDPGLLKNVMQDGIVYSYDLIGMPGDFWLSTDDSTVAILGVSLIRHKDELSVMLDTGENPPHPSDTEILNDVVAPPGKEKLVPDSTLRPADRLVSGLPEYARVVLLTRIYLDSRCYDVRYVLRDLGKSYEVLTDDLVALRDLDEQQTWRQALVQRLHRYDDIFSALTALIYLPAYFVARQQQATTTQFATE
jgi:hypothetical protein